MIALCALGTARAQDAGSTTAVDPRALAQSKELLGSRNRDQMHPGEALKISGLEQNGRDVRARTPALEHSDHTTTAVAQDELYRRTLAIYSNRASFHEALPVDFAATKAVNETPSRHPPRIAMEPASAPSQAWVWLIGLGVSAVVGAWLFRRFGEFVA